MTAKGRTPRTLPPIGLALLSLLLLIGVLQGAAPKATSPNGLVLPNGQQVPIEKTSSSLTSLTPYTPGELWGGGATDEHCATCDAQKATGITGGQSVQSGQSVNPASGDFTESIPLVSVPDQGANLGLTVTYSSELAASQVAAGSLSDWFGDGWTGSAFGGLSISGTQVTVVEPNGSQVTFTNASGSTCPYGDYQYSAKYTGLSSTQSYCAPYRVDAQLSHLTGGDYEFYSQGQKLQMTFDAMGNLIKITDAIDPGTGIFGPFNITYTYGATPGSADCPTDFGSPIFTPVANSYCDVMADSSGNHSSLDFNSSSLASVNGFIDPAGRPYEWGYGSTDWTGGGAIETTSISNPDNSEWQFTYAGSSTPVSVQNTATELTNVTNPDGHTMTIGYSSYGTGSSTGTLATSTTDLSGNFETTYSYENPSDSSNPPSCASLSSGLCLGSGQQLVTTVAYPSTSGSLCNVSTFAHCREIDVDSYTLGVLQSATYGNPNSPGPDEEVTYQTVMPNQSLGDPQDKPIQETVDHYVPGNPTPARSAVITTDSVGNILTVQDANGNLTTYYYNDNVGGTGTGNNFDQLCWVAPANITASALGPPSSWTCNSEPTSGVYFYQYDAWGRVINAEDPIGNVTNYGYYNAFPSGYAYPTLCWVAPPSVALNSDSGDCWGGPTGSNQYSDTIPTGATAYSYDGYGDVTDVYTGANESDQTISEASYNGDAQKLTSSPADGCAVGLGLGSTCTPSSYYVTTLQYDASGLLTKQKSPGPNWNLITTTYKYDSAGNQTYVDRTTGDTSNVYDADNRLCFTAVASGQLSGKTCTSTASSASVTKYTYLADTSAQTTVTDPDGYTTTSSYTDPAYPLSPTEVQDPLGADIVYSTYDDFDNVCASGPVAITPCPTPSQGSTTSGDTFKTYDNLNNVLKSEDASGNLTSYTYAHGSTGYNPFPNLVTSITDPLGNTAQYSYNADGQQIKYQDPSGSNIVTEDYNSDGQKCWQAIGNQPTATCASPPTSSSADATTYAYNNLGQVETMTDNNGMSSQVSSSYLYDQDGNIVGDWDDNGNLVSYSYVPGDVLGCIGYPTAGASENCAESASGTNTVVNYAFNNSGQLTSTTDWLGHTVKYAYSNDGLSNLTKVTYPSSTGEVVTYGYDNASIIESAKLTVPNVTETWGLNNDGLYNSTSQLNSYSSSSSYDGTYNRIKTNTNPGSSGADTYAFYPNGAFESDARSGGSTASYTVNDDSEPTSASNLPSTGNTTYFAYNADGQRCWSSTSSGSACGSPPSGTTTTYQWNAYGELCWSGATTATSSCSSPPSGVTAYTYDGSGLRMTETVGGAKEDFVWNNSGDSSVPELLEDGTNAYIYGPGATPVAQMSLSTNAMTYLVSTPAGVQATVNSGGTLEYDTDYTTFGSPADSGGAGGNDTPFGFQGAYTDPSGLVYLQHRYYDPSTGQFISLDPDVSTTGAPYSYAGDDPTNSSDPSGLFEMGPGGQDFVGQSYSASYQSTVEFLSYVWQLQQFYDAVLKAELETAWIAFHSSITVPGPGGAISAAGVSISWESSLTFQGSDTNLQVGLSPDGVTASASGPVNVSGSFSPWDAVPSFQGKGGLGATSSGVTYTYQETKTITNNGGSEEITANITLSVGPGSGTNDSGVDPGLGNAILHHAFDVVGDVAVAGCAIAVGAEEGDEEGYYICTGQREPSFAS